MEANSPFRPRIVTGKKSPNEPPACDTERRIGDMVTVVVEPAMRNLFSLVKRVAADDYPVLITGETGVGKEHVAHALHCASGKGSEHRPFVPVNCAALPATLVESELFGYQKGAFSGALLTKAGLFETASGGTLFLDEIGELSLAAQAKVLRAVDARRIKRVGDVRERSVDVRIVAATNRDLNAEITRGRFRQDLFFRLGVAVVAVPPLRERPAEIPVLLRRFLNLARTAAHLPALEISPAALAILSAYRWPGNVRELKNTMEFLAATVRAKALEPAHVPASIRAPQATRAAPSSPAQNTSARAPTRFRPLAQEVAELEKRRLIEALCATGDIRAKAAQLLGVPLRTFTNKLRKYGIGGRD